jgi:hypothetical protein
LENKALFFRADSPKETVMTSSDRQVVLATPALPRRQASNGRGVFISLLLLLLCCATMVSWLALLTWGFGYILGIW